MRISLFRWNRANLPLWIFVGFFLLFFVSSSGGFESGDALVRYETAKSILSGGGGALPAGQWWNSSVTTAKGKIFSTYGPMQSLLMLPPLMMAKALSLSVPHQDAFVRLFFNLITIPLLSAMTLVLLYEALGLMGFTPFLATLTVLTLGTATPIWHYARSAQEENMVSLGLCAWLLGILLYNSGRKGGLLLASAGGCFALATRYASLAPLIPLAMVTAYFIWKRFQRTSVCELSAALLLCISTTALLLWYNHYRFGSYLETGYGILFRELSMPLFSLSQAPMRVLVLLFSPYRGLFLFSPVLVFALIALARNWRKLSAEEWAGLAAMGAALLLNASYSYWNGGFSWGPRFLVAPLILISPLFARFFQRNALDNWWKPIVFISVVIQVASISLPSSTEDIIRERAEVSPLSLANAWKCEYSALCLRPAMFFSAIRNTLMNRPGLSLTAGTTSMEKSLESSDYRTLFWWPFRFSFRFGYFNRFIAFFITFFILATSVCVLTTALRVSRSRFLLRSA